MVYPTIGLDGKRCRKIQEDTERYEKIGKDGKRWESTAALLENAGFPVLQRRMNSLTTGSLPIVYLCCAVGT